MIIADLFCGAGGTSAGAIEAARKAGRTINLTAINHWPTAVRTHGENHDGRHLCADLDSLNPRSLFSEDGLDVLWASPECTHHSNARGGRPMRDQSRATAWCVVRWAEALRPRRIFVENVKEFQDWGPLHQVPDPDSELKLGLRWRPDPARKGEVFRAWVGALTACGYRVEWRMLCAADFGSPTTRRRLFIQAALGDLPIIWPTPTHAELPDASQKRWTPARAILDLEDTGPSIFERAKPLADATLRRISIGLEKYGLHPHLVHLRGTSTVCDLEKPVPTITAGGGHFGLVTPFVCQLDHTTQRGSGCRSIEQPLTTIVTKQTHALVTPFLVQYYGTGSASSIEKPVPTCTTKPRFGLAHPKLIALGDRTFKIDIRFRMLRPDELSRAQGFPDSYRFVGSKEEVVRQIGNAVPPQLSAALLQPYL